MVVPLALSPSVPPGLGPVDLPTAVRAPFHIHPPHSYAMLVVRSHLALNWHIALIMRSVDEPAPRVRPTEPRLPCLLTTGPLYVVVETVSKLYNDGMGRFTIRSRSDHRYVMLTFHCDSNVILIEPFQSRHDRHHITAYSRIMTCLHKRVHRVGLQVLDNEASK